MRSEVCTVIIQVCLFFVKPLATPQPFPVQSKLDYFGYRSIVATSTASSQRFRTVMHNWRSATKSVVLHGASLSYMYNSTCTSVLVTNLPRDVRIYMTCITCWGRVQVASAASRLKWTREIDYQRWQCDDHYSVTWDESSGGVYGAKDVACGEIWVQPRQVGELRFFLIWQPETAELISLVSKTRRVRNCTLYFKYAWRAESRFCNLFVHALYTRTEVTHVV